LQKKFDIDEKFNLILEDGFKAIQKNCGPEFDIEKMNSFDVIQHYCSRFWAN
jgi:spermidine synthase